MPRHQVTVEGSTLADIEAAITALRGAGATDSAVIRLRVRAALSADGGAARVLTARWDTDHD